jgi:predicted metalloprotease
LGWAGTAIEAKEEAVHLAVFEGRMNPVSLQLLRGFTRGAPLPIVPRVLVCGPLMVVLLAMLSLGLVACGGGGDDSASSSSSSRNRDTDRDKILDRKDACPKEKEDGGKWSGNDTDGCPETIEDLIELGRSQVDSFWAESFAAENVAYEGPRDFVAYSTPIRTGCGEAGLHNAFFCGADHSIYYDISFFQEELDTNGDYSPVFILAHEWGHLVQDLLNILYDESRYSIQNELQADCLAGLFTKHAEEIGLLEDRDFDEAVVALFRVGDPDDTPFFDPQAHGSPGQRIDAFNKGFNRGLGACLSDF